RVEAVRAASDAVRVTSVSKTAESLREAPATVAVITAEEIARRGYLDLEDLFHDLPGFAVSRANGVTYSHLYQRGYRSASTDRTLLLVDGVEQNDLTSDVAYVSRHFPLVDVDRVEVIYGPASTIYGANAFAGVINVITKSPDDVLGEGELWSADAYLGGGSFGTEYVDAVAAGRTPSGSLSWSVTGRVFRSDEPDLSGRPDWDYDPAVFDAVDYGEVLGIGGRGSDGRFAAEAFLEEGELPASPYYEVRRDASGTATAIVPTAQGAARARELDRAAFAARVGGEPVGFSDSTDDWWLSAKLVTTGLEVGFQSWEREEGITPWYHELEQPGARNGALWTPRETAVYAKYSREIGPAVDLGLFSQYMVHDLAPESATFNLATYANGRLSLRDLARDEPGRWERTNLFRSSNQLRTELTLTYQPSERLDLVAGVELRDGEIQGDYVRSTEPVAAETGTAPRSDGGNQFHIRDLGAFAQLTYRPRQDWKLVAGGRIDDNTIRETGGYGTVFSPRLAVVYTPGSWVFRAVYAEAFQDASNFNKFATLPGVRDLPAPDLSPERVKNYEVAAGWKDERLSAELAAFQAGYSQVVGLRSVPFQGGTTGQFQNLGELRIRGLQGTATWRAGAFDLYGNYTYTEPFNTTPLDDAGEPLLDDGRPVDELRIGDIPDHQANLGVNVRLWERFGVNLRGSYVGDRPTGQGTTVTTNPFDEIDAYFVADLALTARNVLSRRMDVQLLVNNLLDSDYYHPGIRQAGATYAARVPQPGRAAFLRLVLRR
ncbi:MAG: TonB-dependent receptor plug domain-containing protein, partial [Acidobacteriota bacterium]